MQMLNRIKRAGHSDWGINTLFRKMGNAYEGKLAVVVIPKHLGWIDRAMGEGGDIPAIFIKKPRGFALLAFTYDVCGCSPSGDLVLGPFWVSAEISKIFKVGGLHEMGLRCSLGLLPFFISMGGFSFNMRN
jgi:hypothetical protein